MTGSPFSRYEQFDTSLETIEQVLRPAVCKHRQTDLRRIVVGPIDLHFYSVGIGLRGRSECECKLLYGSFVLDYNAELFARNIQTR